MWKQNKTLIENKEKKKFCKKATFIYQVSSALFKMHVLQCAFFIDFPHLFGFFVKISKLWK